MKHKIAWTPDYFVTSAPFPCSIALFSCSCGARAVEYDLKQGAPAAWTTAQDGSQRCPACSTEAASRAS
jgi:hypothetical protein